MLTSRARGQNRASAAVRLLRLSVRILAIVGLVFLLPVGCKVAAHYTGEQHNLSWSQLRRDSSQQAPAPEEHDQAVIQVYAARAARWRGAFGVHSWIAVKPSGASHYTRIEVMGYALRWSGTTVRVRSGRPDGYWYGNRPWLLRDIRGGDKVDEMIERLLVAADSYPYDDQYSVWPGPNSNTFIAWLGRAVPEMRLELPPTAIGKDFLPAGALAMRTPSGTGVQVSARGLLGVMVSSEEGLEVNFLGLTAGIDLYPPAVKLPGIGRVGMQDYRKKIM
ncbi:MAG: DUF3750 domain-containing protein [Gammaproteobacteria bacterium]|nr:DUF3750 domain-containing protein [Gammaproteobacteria bacterium]